MEPGTSENAVEPLREAAISDSVLTHPALDTAFTTMPLTPAAIYTKRGTLFINMAGLAYRPGKRFALDVKVGDCALS